MDEFHAEKPSSFAGNEVGRKKEKRRIVQRTTATTVVDIKSHKLTKNKRKNVDESSSSKVKKRKTSIDHTEIEEHCQELIQSGQKKKKSLKSKRKSREAMANVQPMESDINSCSQLEKQRKGKDRKKDSNPELCFTSDCDVIHNLWNPSEELSKHLGLKKGKWSKKEEKILSENMDRYLKRHNIDDPKKIIFAYQDIESEEGKKWKEFAKSTDFYRKLSKDLKRSLYFVYRKALRMFDDSNYLGRYSESEDKELLRLVAAHGRKWNEIGGMMGRSNMSVSHRYYLIKDETNSGPWQETEIKSLHEAVRKLTNTKDGEEVYSGINWTTVALIVKTRNIFQCRGKWLRDLCWMDCKLHTTEGVWSTTHEVELIDKIYKSQVTEECDIDWLSLTTEFDISRSPEWLMRKFWFLKRKYCKSIDFEVVEFEDVIDYLYNVVAIDLQNQIFQHQQQNS